jgi:hypothetical protein
MISILFDKGYNSDSVQRQNIIRKNERLPMILNTQNSNKKAEKNSLSRDRAVKINIRIFIILLIITLPESFWPFPARKITGYRSLDIDSGLFHVKNVAYNSISLALSRSSVRDARVINRGLMSSMTSYPSEKLHELNTV